MIEWLVQTAGKLPDLGRGAPPPGLLAPEELDRLGLLHVPKRRRDWLLGRFTAKRLLGAVLERQQPGRVPLSQLVLRADRSGAPRAYLVAPLTSGAPIPALPLPLSVSISHSHAEALCAVSTVPGVQVGADVERLEPRAAGFVSDYFTADEQAWVHRSLPPERDRLVTAIWSAKEAVLKALKLGLTVDTRQLCCLPALDTKTDAAHWNPTHVRCEPALWRTAGFAPARPPTLRAWWRTAEQRIYTVAALAPIPPTR